MPTRADYEFMAEAVRIAKRGLFTADPNPRVGCVIVKEGAVVGRGWHQWAGQAHAEVNALADAGEAARGATAYVTLEPCCHFGKTPPCVQALIAASVKRVVVAMQDPHDLVAGRGIAQLREAGMEVEVGVLEAQARALNPGFIHRCEHQRPWVRCKMAMSLDGRTALANGESQWITSEASRRDVHYWRARSSAVLTGSGTVCADNPRLTARLHNIDETEVQQPWRIILSKDLKIPPSSQLLHSEGGAVLIYHAEHGQRALLNDVSQTQCAVVGIKEEQLDLHAVLADLAQRQINEVLVEAGATLAGAFLRAGLVDELLVYMAPHVMGDRARGLFHLPGIETMSQRYALKIADVRQFGSDLRLILHS